MSAMTPATPAGPHTARLKRWLLVGAAAIALIGGLWVVIQLTSPAPRGGRGSLERQLTSNQNRSAAELERERRQLARELEGLQSAIGSGRTTSPAAAPDTGPALATTNEVPPSPSTTTVSPERRSETTPPEKRHADAGAVPPLRRDDQASPTPRRDGAGYQEAALPGASPPDLPAFPDAVQPKLPQDALFQHRQSPPATQDPATTGSRGGAAGGAALQPPKPVIRIVGSDVPENQPLPPAENATYRLPATSILTGTLITGLDASTATQSRREPFPVLLRLQKTAILPNRYQADVRECFVLLAGYGDLSSERAYLRGETVSCVLLDGSVIETRLQGYAAGEDGKAGVRGRLVTKQGQFIARALMVGFIEGVSEVLQKGDTVTLGLSQSQNQDDGNPWGSAALKGTGNALDRIAQFYIDQAYNLFPVIEIDAGRQLDIVLTSHLDMPLPNS